MVVDQGGGNTALVDAVTPSNVRVVRPTRRRPDRPVRRGAVQAQLKREGRLVWRWIACAARSECDARLLLGQTWRRVGSDPSILLFRRRTKFLLDFFSFCWISSMLINGLRTLNKPPKNARPVLLA